MFISWVAVYLPFFVSWLFTHRRAETAPVEPKKVEVEVEPKSSRVVSGEPVNALVVLAGLSRATIPVPYWVVARAVDEEALGVLLALVELESAGVVQSRRFSGGGVLYAIAGEKRWRETW